MKGERRQSGHLMLISPQRVSMPVCSGDRAAGRPAASTSIATVEGCLTVTREGRSDRATTVAVVPPYVPHTVESEHPTVICVIDRAGDRAARRPRGLGQPARR